MSLRLIVDHNSCIGSGECVSLDPDAVELDADGMAHVLVPELEEARARDLCDVCPTGALSIDGS